MNLRGRNAVDSASMSTGVGVVSVRIRAARTAASRLPAWTTPTRGCSVTRWNPSRTARKIHITRPTRSASRGPNPAVARSTSAAVREAIVAHHVPSAIGMMVRASTRTYFQPTPVRCSQESPGR